MSIQNLQQIYYGAPGTGKSHKVNELTKGKSVVRTTFHPDSDYSTFVGAYKPTMCKHAEKILSINELKATLLEQKLRGENYPCHKFATNYWYSLSKLQPSEIKEIIKDCGFKKSMYNEIHKGVSVGKDVNDLKKDRIVYEFVPQAFLLAYVKAWKFYAEAKEEETPKKQYFIIEEINRGNCAQIFGDLFQLLDRDEHGFSKYYVHADSDIKAYLVGKLGELKMAQKDWINECCEENVIDRVLSGEILLLPSNLYIWATMNTSDQSLFPIDSAFKRRWDWVYVPIAKGVDRKSGEEFRWKIVVGTKEYDWWDFLEAINKQIAATTNSEDKKLGFFFCQAKGDEIDAETFVSKVLFYLWNDVFKDYGFDGELFKATDGNPLTFNKFYKVMRGEAIPSVENVQLFLENLGMVGVARDSNGDVDEKNEDDDAVGINGNGTSVQKGDKFSINGKGIYGFNETMRQAVMEYVNLHHKLSARMVVEDWRALGIRLKAEKRFIQTSDEYREWAKNIKDPETRVKEVAVGNDVIYVSTQVQCYDMEDFINKVHTKEQDWGIHIEKVK